VKASKEKYKYAVKDPRNTIAAVAGWKKMHGGEVLKKMHSPQVRRLTATGRSEAAAVSSYFIDRTSGTSAAVEGK
jgi:hypothetical protein